MVEVIRLYSETFGDRSSVEVFDDGTVQMTSSTGTFRYRHSPNQWLVAAGVKSLLGRAVDRSRASLKRKDDD